MTHPERAGGLRLIRIVLTATAAGVVILSVGMVTLFSFNAERLRLIQASRMEATQSNCEDVNRRHDAAIAELEAIIDAQARRVTTVAARRRLQASRQTSTALIEALVPKRDCVAYAREQVKTDP